MKRLSIALAAVALLGLAVRAAQAQPGDKKPEDTKPARAEKKPRLWGAHAQMEKVCDLSEEQVKQIVQLNNTRKEALADWDKVNGAKLKELQTRSKQAMEDQQRDKAMALYKEYRALWAKRKEIDLNSRKEIMAVLLPEQKAKWLQYVAMRTIKRRFTGVKFTDEQVSKIGAAHKKFAAEAKAGVMKKLSDYVAKEILTPEQTKAYAKAKAARKERLRTLREAARKPKPTATKPAEVKS